MAANIHLLITHGERMTQIEKGLPDYGLSYKHSPGNTLDFVRYLLIQGSMIIREGSHHTLVFSLFCLPDVSIGDLLGGMFMVSLIYVLFLALQSDMTVPMHKFRRVHSFRLC